MKTNPEIVLVDVLKNGGCFGEDQVAALAEAFPAIRVGVKFGCSPRTSCTMAEVADVIRSRLAMHEDEYVREAFIVADEYDRLRAERGIRDPYQQSCI